MRSSTPRAGAYLKDPWAARDDYGAVVLDRDPRRLEAFLASPPGGPRSTPTPALSARRLLELQRNRMLMYTSCGWFFDEISGLEPVQILEVRSDARCSTCATWAAATWSRSFVAPAGGGARAMRPTTPTAARSIAGW